MEKHGRNSAKDSELLKAKYQLLYGVDYTCEGGILTRLSFRISTDIIILDLGLIASVVNLYELEVCEGFNGVVRLVIDERIASFDSSMSALQTMKYYGMFFDIRNITDTILDNVFFHLMLVNYDYNKVLGDARMRCTLLECAIFGGDYLSNFTGCHDAVADRMFLEKRKGWLLITKVLRGSELSTVDCAITDNLLQCKDYESFLEYMSRKHNAMLKSLFTGVLAETAYGVGTVLNHQWGYFLYGGTDIEIYKNMMGCLRRIRRSS